MNRLLPSLRLDLTEAAPGELKQLFPVPVRDVWLEIGFGAGEHLLWQAEAHPKIGFIGCEPFLNGVAKVLSSIEKDSLNAIRLYDDDARHLLHWLPAASLGRVFILFPDPWPKKRHLKRRFLSKESIEDIARVMRLGSELRFATDIADYAEMVTKRIEASDLFSSRPGLLGERPSDWPMTRYAEKALAARRECRFFVFERL
jgi:tRNA (guanine-N7-)-methyltransferase